MNAEKPVPLTPRAAFFAGARALSPILLGVLPFAAIAGVTVVSVGVPLKPALAMSFIMFAGAAQLTVSELIGQQAPWFVAVAAALVVNLRFTMYSAYMAPHLSHLDALRKAPLAAVLSDQAYAVFATRMADHPDRSTRTWFYAGAAVWMWAAYQAGCVAGVLLGMRVPQGWSLEFAVPLTFLALLAPAVRDRSAAAAGLASAVTAVLAVGLPLKLGLFLAALVGIGTGLVVENRRTR